MRTAVSVLVAAVMLGACGGGGQEAESIAVAPSAFTIDQHATQQLSPSVRDQDGRAMSSSGVTYAVTDPAIVTVSESGLVTGKHAGSTTIVAAVGGVTTDVSVTVTPIVAGLAATPNPIVLAPGATVQLVAQVLDLEGDPLAGAHIIFESANYNVADVNASGLVRSVGPSGTTVIHVYYSTYALDVPVTVPASIATN